MSVRNGLALLLALSALLFLAACGSSSPKVVPPPSGGFTDSNLNGTYVFSTTGVDASRFFLTIVGDFVANGSGGITGGAIDIVSSDSNVGVSTNLAVASSKYSITQDGRGQATLNVPGGAIVLDFVLQSSSHGVVTEYDSLGTGSGTIDAQPSVVAQTSLSNLSFGLSGVGPTSTFATVGSVSLDTSGNVTVGVEDFNSGGTPTVDQAITPTNSFVTVGSGTSPGTAQLVTPLGTFVYDVYAVDSTHLKLVETDGALWVSGDAYVPATALPTGTLAFTMAGFDTSGFPLALGGFLPASSGGAITAGTEDFNDDGNVNLNPVTGVGGGFSALSGGRSTLSLTGFVNGAANDLAGSYTFAAYPFTSNGATGVQLLEIDSLIPNAVTSGVAYAQSSTSVTAAQGYALNLSAINLNPGSTPFEEDDIAEFTTTSSGFTGIVDLNDESTLTFDKSLNGTYSVDGTGRGSASTNYFNYNFYVVNSSTFLLMETDSNQIGTGVFEMQGNATSPGLVQPASASLLRPAVSPRVAKRRK